MPKQVLFNDEGARPAPRNQRDGLGVKATGPQGPQRDHRQEVRQPTITKDGVTVAKEIELKDTFENMGARYAQEVAPRLRHRRRRDTTATVLGQPSCARASRTSPRGPIDGPQARDQQAVTWWSVS